MCTICGCGRVIITVLLINLDFSQGLNQNFKRDVLSLNLICKTKCVSRCLYENTKIFAQCETECGHNTTMSCHKVICLPSLCQMDYMESDLLANSDSQEDNAYRTPVWGSLLLQSSLASFRIEWLLPPNMTSSIDGPLLYFTETLQEVTWVPSLTILLKPEAAFVGRCQSKTIRFVAVDSHGMVGASPYQTFNYSSSRSNSLQVTNITMSTLSMSNKIVRGLLSWKLPAGINNTDVAKYHLSIVKDYSCVSATAPSIQAFANEERADVENIQLMCRYVFHISYSTTCGEKSPDVIYTNKLECTSVEGGRCIRSNRSFGGRSNHRLGPNQTISAAEILVTEAYGKRSTEETIERGEEQEESELSPGALAGAIAGPLLALLCFSVTAVYCCRRYQRLLQERLSSKLLPSMSSGSNSSSSSYSITNTALHSSQSSSSTSTSQTLPLPPPVATDRWELDRSRIAFGASIGNGAYGEVLKGVVEGSLNAPHGHVLFNCTVAIKRLPESADLLEKDAFLREIKLMKALGRHSQVVSLLGACMTSEPILLVLEYCALGDLRGYLSSKRQTAISLQSATVSSSYLPVTCVSQLTLTTLLSFSRQIALGMEYVHGRGYIHRDLAARNLLVTDSDHVKIGDFGLARYLDEDSNYVMLNPGKLPLKWMAIESIVNLAFSPASDVWSFGVVLFEIITMGGTPYPTINNNDLLSQLRKGSRMGCPQNCSQELYDVMMSCWREEPLERPSFAVLETDLCKLLDESAGAEKYLKFDSDKDYYQIDPNKYHY